MFILGKGPSFTFVRVATNVIQERENNFLEKKVLVMTGASLVCSDGVGSIGRVGILRSRKLALACSPGPFGGNETGRLGSGPR